jgi:pSer/pThr/pTyr-binding forkhead associated (FHA) protein
MRRIPILVVSEGALKGNRMPIADDGIVIGRGEACQFVLTEQGVSREHCRVLVHNSGVWVRDLGSRNGVFLKGKRVNRPKQMMPGDVLKIGEHEFTVELGPLASGDETTAVFAVGTPPNVSPPPTEASQSQASGGSVQVNGGEDSEIATSGGRSLVIPVIALLILLGIATAVSLW